MRAAGGRFQNPMETLRHERTEVLVLRGRVGLHTLAFVLDHSVCCGLMMACERDGVQSSCLTH